MTKIYLASDHAGVELKSRLIQELTSGEYLRHYEVQDLGPQSTASVDYPDYADLVCKKIHGFTLIDSKDSARAIPAEFGILICGTGQGMNIRANKYQHIRAALCWTPEIAKLSREHNDANVLCLAARFMPPELCLEMIALFLSTPFAGGRHSQRVVKLSAPV
jgi:ribose 5-phosphate isomerase B